MKLLVGKKYAMKKRNKTAEIIEKIIIFNKTGIFLSSFSFEVMVDALSYVNNIPNRNPPKIIE